MTQDQAIKRRRGCPGSDTLTIHTNQQRSQPLNVDHTQRTQYKALGRRDGTCLTSTSLLLNAVAAARHHRDQKPKRRGSSSRAARPPTSSPQSTPHARRGDSSSTLRPCHRLRGYVMPDPCSVEMHGVLAAETVARRQSTARPRPITRYAPFEYVCRCDWADGDAGESGKPAACGLITRRCQSCLLRPNFRVQSHFRGVGLGQIHFGRRSSSSPSERPLAGRWCEVNTNLTHSVCSSASFFCLATFFWWAAQSVRERQGMKAIVRPPSSHSHRSAPSKVLSDDGNPAGIRFCGKGQVQ